MARLNLLKPRLKPNSYRQMLTWYGGALAVLLCASLVVAGAVSFQQANGPRQKVLELRRAFLTETAEKQSEISTLSSELSFLQERLSFLRQHHSLAFDDYLRTLEDNLPPQGTLVSVSFSNDGGYSITGNLSTHSQVADYMDQLKTLSFDPYLEFSTLSDGNTVFSLHGTLAEKEARNGR